MSEALVHEKVVFIRRVLQIWKDSKTGNLRVDITDETNELVNAVKKENWKPKKSQTTEKK